MNREGTNAVPFPIVSKTLYGAACFAIGKE
jgi:hypothetical protein